MSTQFLQNALLLNLDKSEAVIFDTRQRLSSIDKNVGVRVASSVVQFTGAVILLSLVHGLDAGSRSSPIKQRIAYKIVSAF